MMRSAFEIVDTRVAAGSRSTVDIPMAGLYTHTPVTLPVHVVHGHRAGPVLFVSAAVHGDEINGVEIIRRLIRSPALGKLRGTLLAVPIVNVFGFHNRSRYLPDRRDLNRSFPGSEQGSMASRVANLFLREIVQRADYGVDLHTAAIHRDNLPQVRANLSNEQIERMAMAFGAPVVIHSEGIEGSLRMAAMEQGVPMILYEAGEALRFDELCIRTGLRGVVEVMRTLGMLPRPKAKRRPAILLRSSVWVRAPKSGILRSVVSLGTSVASGDTLGIVSDPFGEREVEIVSTADGVIIGRANLPLVYEGEALFHIGRSQSGTAVEAHLEELQQALDEAQQEAPDELPIV